MDDSQLKRLEKRVAEDNDANALAQVIHAYCSQGRSIYKFLPAIVSHRDDDGVRGALQEHALLDVQVYGRKRGGDRYEELLNKDRRDLINGSTLALHSLMNRGGVLDCLLDDELGNDIIPLRESAFCDKRSVLLLRETGIAGGESARGPLSRKQFTMKKADSGAKYVRKTESNVFDYVFGNLRAAMEAEFGSFTANQDFVESIHTYNHAHQGYFLRQVCISRTSGEYNQNLIFRTGGAGRWIFGITTRTYQLLRPE